MNYSFLFYYEDLHTGTVNIKPLVSVELLFKQAA